MRGLPCYLPACWGCKCTWLQQLHDVQERTYIIGPHGGKADTVHVLNFTDHISDIFALPDADIPIPYTELLITAIPGYKRKGKGMPAWLRPQGWLSHPRGTCMQAAQLASDAASRTEAGVCIDDGCQPALS